MVASPSTYSRQVAAARTAHMKPDRVSEAVALIGSPWRTCLTEPLRNKARAHMAVLASQAPAMPAATLAVNGLRRINIIARAVNETLVVPSDQWSKAYA